MNYRSDVALSVNRGKMSVKMRQIAGMPANMLTVNTRKQDYSTKLSAPDQKTCTQFQ